MNKRILHTVFEQQALRVPDHTAVAEENEKISYRELNSRANQLAHLLRKLGVGKDSIVSVLTPASIGLSVALLAVWKAGGVYLPMDIAFSRKRLQQMFTQTGTRILITSKALQQAAQQLINELNADVPHLIILEEVNGYSTENPELINEPGDSNYIFYTSGSTGEAKAFLGCHDSLSHFIHWEMKAFGIDESFKVSQLSQITFDASLRDMLLPLSTGGTLCIPGPETKSNVIQLLEWMEAHHVTLVHCVPSLTRLFTKELLNDATQQVRLPRLKHILMAGEPLYGKDLQQWQATGARHVELVNLYGTSETTLAKTCHRIKNIPGDPAQVIHVGQPISNTAVMIMNQDMLCEPGRIGEVYIRTPFMTKGYYQNEALTKKVFVQNPLATDRTELMHKTGDMGKYLPDGNIEILGRLDDQVKVNGIRVELNEIKQAVLSMPGISEAVVLAHKNNDHQNELACYYIAANVTPEVLRAHLETELNANIIPSYFIPMTEFPLTINGKVDKRALPKPEALVIDEADYEPVENETEQALEQIWKNVLGLNRIGRKAHFFKIGGTSLKAMQVISRIYQQFEVPVKLSEIFSRPSISQLAAFVANAASARYQEISTVPEQEYYDVTPAQKGLWIQDQFGTDQILYNMPAAFMLEGGLDIPMLEKALHALIARHESLRTIFISIGGDVKQKILPANDNNAQLDITDLRGNANPLESARELSLEEIATPFVLHQGPLIRARLLQVAGNRSIFLFNTHHIISDGRSEEILAHELFVLYEAYSNGQTPALPALKVQYKDYAAWMNTQLNDEQLQDHAGYWQQQFTGELPVLLFPTDQPRPALRSTNGNVLDFHLDPALTARLTAYTQQQGVSLFIVLTAAVKALLNRYTGQEDIIIGAPIAGRHHRDTENLVGLFVNMLALRTQFSTSGTFGQLLEQVKQTVLEAYEHQLYPFDQLIRSLDLEYDNKRAPLADVWVQLTDAALSFGDMDGLTVTEYNAGYLTSKVDLTFKFTAANDRLHTIIEYNTDLFKRTTIEQIQHNFFHLLNTVLTNDGIRLSDIDLLASGAEEAEMEDFLRSMQNI